MIARTLVALFLALVFLAMASGQNTAKTPAASVQVPANYRIQANDLLEVEIDQEEADSGQVRVSSSGRASVRLIGEINLAGLRLDQAARAIEASLRNGYLVNPKVSVQIAAYGKQGRFTVLGAVAKQGNFEMPPDKPFTLVEAVATAGPTNLANPRKVLVKSTVAGKEMNFTFDVKAMAESNNKAKQYIVRDGDIITVKERIL